MNPNRRRGFIRSLVGALAALLVVGAAAQPAGEGNRVRITEVEVGLSPVGPVVLLKAENHAIPIFVDGTVAESINAALTRQKLPRPLSHELMHSILTSYDGRVTEIYITLKGATYYAALSMMLGGVSKVFDSRSSDAIALAVHFNAPIWVPRELLESAGKPRQPPEGGPTLRL